MDTPVGERSGSGSVAEGALTGMEGDDVGDGIEAMAVSKSLLLYCTISGRIERLSTNELMHMHISY